MTGPVRPRLLLVASFTELEWAIRPRLEEWAEVASFDMPGVGGQPIPAEIDDPAKIPELLPGWRGAGAEAALRLVDDLGWSEFLIVSDDLGAPTAVAIARRRRDSIRGLALGHAALSHATAGDRAPMNPAIWDVMVQLTRQGNEQFVRYGIAQATQGGITEEVARQMTERFPDMALVTATFEALSQEPEPIGDDLAALDLPMLLGKHDGCLGRTDEGFEDIVAAFPRARTVICPETCPASPAFAKAVRGFCEEVLATESASVHPERSR
jgi:pimeloyl-ACP methyl ester carboxylesterase